MKYIAIHTFFSLMREKIIFNVFGITILMLFIGYLSSQLVYGHQDRVMLDLGIMINSLSIFAVSIGIGSRFLRQELENKTIYLPLTRPISRTKYYLAKFNGLGSFLVMNYLLLSLLLFVSVSWMNGDLGIAYFQSAVLTMVESLILLAASLWLSFFLRPALVYMCMIAFVFLGHNHEMLRSLQENPETHSIFFEILTKLSPNFSILLMSDRVYYSQPLHWNDFLLAQSYGIVWVLFFILIGNAVFSRKNL